MKRVNVSELNRVCVKLLEGVRQTGKPIEVTKDGKPMVVARPAFGVNRKAAFGALRGSLAGPVGDLISPLDKIW